MATASGQADVVWAMTLGLVALAVNLIAIGHPAIWRDETATIQVARRSPAAIMRLLHHDDAPLGPYYLFMHLWLKVAGSASWARLPSAIGSAAAVGFVSLLGRRLGGRSVGIVAGVVLAVLPFNTRYAQEARPYALVMGAATGATWLLVVAQRERRSAVWIAYSAVMAVAVALHEMVALLAVAHLVTLAAVNGRQYRRYGAWLLSVLPAAAISVVLTVGAIGNSTDRSWIAKPGLAAPYRVAVDFAGSRPALALLFAVILAAVVAGPRWLGACGLLAVAVPWLLIPGGLLIVVSRLEPIFLPRYVVFCLPALALIAAAAAVQVMRALSGDGLRLLAAGVAAAALVAVVAAPQRALRRLDAHGDNPKAEAADLIAVSRPGDGIAYLPRDVAHSLLTFAAPSQLPADALLERSAEDSATLNGVVVAPSAVPAAVLRFSRMWLLELPGLKDSTPAAVALRVTLAARYRRVSSERLHGTVLVLFDRQG